MDGLISHMWLGHMRVQSLSSDQHSALQKNAGLSHRHTRHYKPDTSGLDRMATFAEVMNDELVSGELGVICMSLLHCLWHFGLCHCQASMRA